MNSSLGTLRKLFLAVSGLGCLLASASAFAASFSISPSAITNDFEGIITLSITNLTPGQTVVVEQFADLNGNGAIDPGEPLISHFTVTDGQLPLIGGIRNPNVPGDDDGATNGQLQVKLFFPSVDTTISDAAIKSVVRVSQSQGLFAPVTQPFSVAQKFYPQGVTGRVTDSATGLPLTNTLIGLGSQSTSGARVTQTDGNGFFTLYLLPNTYSPVVVKDGYISDQNNQATVVCNQFATNNPTPTNVSLTISGKVSDIATGAGLAGLLITANSTNNLFTAAFTDTNGNYTLPVSPNNQWKLRPDKPGPDQIGYLALANRVKINVAGSSISGVNISLPKATALIYGAVRDDRGNPVAGLPVFCQDTNGSVEIDGRSFATNGNYALGVTNGTWGFVVGELNLHGFTGQFTNLNISSGQAVQADLVVSRTNFPALVNFSRAAPGHAQFTLNGLAGQTYLLQAVTSLGSTNWTTFLKTNCNCNTVTILDSSATNTSQFYRAQIVP